MMKISLSAILLIVIQGCTHNIAEVKSNDEGWSVQNREDYLNNRNDSTTWDKEMFRNDLNLCEIGDLGPFVFGVFPVPNYDLIGKGSFNGLGNKSVEYQVQEKKILMNSFVIGENTLNKSRLKGKKDEVFFQILILTDTIDDENYSLAQSNVISRNHPDYLGQGFVETKNNRIDYLAFQTADNRAYAIVNTRLFDLSFGKTIIIQPQKDKTLRSLQIKSPPLSSESINDYTNKLLKQKETMLFLVKKGSI